MNPWAVIILLIAGGCIVVAAKGTQDNLISAIKGKPYGSSVLSNSSTGTNQGTAPAPSTGLLGGPSNDIWNPLGIPWGKLLP